MQVKIAVATAALAAMSMIPSCPAPVVAIDVIVDVAATAARVAVREAVKEGVKEGAKQAVDSATNNNNNKRSDFEEFNTQAALPEKRGESLSELKDGQGLSIGPITPPHSKRDENHGALAKGQTFPDAVHVERSLGDAPTTGDIASKTFQDKDTRDVHPILDDDNAIFKRSGAERFVRRSQYPGVPDYNIQMCKNANNGKTVTVTEESSSSIKLTGVPSQCMVLATVFTESGTPIPCGNDCLNYVNLSTADHQKLMSTAKNLMNAK